MIMMNRNSTRPMEKRALRCKAAHRGIGHLRWQWRWSGSGRLAKRDGILATLPATMMMAMASPMARPDAQHHGGGDAAAGGGNAHAEDRLQVGGAQGQGGLLIVLRARPAGPSPRR